MPHQSHNNVGGVGVATTRFPLRHGFNFLEMTISSQGNSTPTLSLTPSLCHVGMLVAGEVTLYIPELGKRQLKPGQWFIGAMDSLPVTFKLSSSVTLFTLECNVEVFSSLLAGTKMYEQGRLSCLVCPERKQPFFEHGNVAGKLLRLSSVLAETKCENLSQRLTVESRILEWLAVLLEQPELNQKQNCRTACRLVDEEALMAAAHYLENYLAEEHTIATISRKVHLNEFKLKKGFRELFDTTVFGFLREKRMEHAGELLKQSSCSVIEVANAVGYANPSHFARAFKEHHGMLPKHFQKTHAYLT